MCLQTSYRRLRVFKVLEMGIVQPDENFLFLKVWVRKIIDEFLDESMKFNGFLSLSKR